MDNTTHPSTNTVDITVDRGNTLMGLCHHLSNNQNGTMEALLLRYAECIVREQERYTREFIEEMSKGTVH